MNERTGTVIKRTGRDDNRPDLIISNGWVVDGTGNPKFRADIAVKGDRIIEVGRLGDADAAVIIDAAGKIVCPGLIDAHSHTDGTIVENPTAESTVRQGVTTEIVGNCGGNKGLNTKKSDGAGGDILGADHEDAGETYTFAEFLEVLEKKGTSNNLAWLAGHNSIRRIAGVSGQTVTRGQLSAMGKLLRETLDAGAIGFSTGLEFEPGRSCSPDEIKFLAEIVSEYDGIYASHIRNRDVGVLDAVDEFLNIVETCGIRGELSHMNIRYNTGAPAGAWEKCVLRMENSRSKGFDVLADMTPLNYGTGQAAGILPPWIRNVDPEETVKMLRDTEIRRRLRTECDRYWRFIHRGEWDRVIVQSNPSFPEINGMGMVEVSRLWGRDPWECYFDIMASAGTNIDGISFVGRLFTDEHLHETISHPLYMLAMDGCSTSIEGNLAKRTSFPLHYMGMTYFLTHHVREKHTLTLEDAVRKMTSMPATHFRLHDRGNIRKGAYADIVIMDFDRLDTVSTIEKPLAYVKGVEYVFVNGVPVVSQGSHTGARPGRNLLRKAL